MEFRASEGRGFQPRRTDARNLTCCKCWDAICGGAEAPPFQSVSQQFFSKLRAASLPILLGGPPGRAGAAAQPPGRSLSGSRGLQANAAWSEPGR